MDEHFFLYNGRLFLSGTAVLDEQNTALKYGDGLFETMRFCRGKLINDKLHFERLFNDAATLKFLLPETYSADYFSRQIKWLVEKNHLQENARVRLMLFRHRTPSASNIHYLVETYPLQEAAAHNKAGLYVDVYDVGRKSCDIFSNIKSSNYLPNVMAIIYAEDNRLDECFILNCFGRVCESAISNVFIIRDGRLYTPPLSEGCVNGVLRRWLINHLPILNMEVVEAPLSVEDILEADEVFLTNSIRLIRWIKYFRNKKYHCHQTRLIADFVFQNLIPGN